MTDLRAALEDARKWIQFREQYARASEAERAAALQMIDAALAAKPPAFVDIVFDGPPSHESGRFVEVENDRGESINIGEWVDRPDGYWALRIPAPSAE